MNKRFLVPLCVLILPLVVGCDARIQSDSLEAESQQTTHQVDISIDSEQRIFVNGEAVSLDELQGILVSKLVDDKADFVITVAPRTPMGLVSEVQQQLPPNNVASIHYPEARG